jgi:RNA polymerase sigma-70 factor (ECF subfamily)
MSSELDTWFANNILPHEAALMRYLRRVCRSTADVPDLRQDVYIRVYESAAKRLPEMPKAFLFATARNLITDRVRRGRIVSIDYAQDLDSLNVLIDDLSPEQHLSAHQELGRLAEALDSLSTACREVIWLRRVEGLSQREAAERLGMVEGTLESHLCRGLRALADALYGCDNVKEAKHRARGSAHEAEHG